MSLADLLQTPSSFKDKQEPAKHVTLLSYHIYCSMDRWACLLTYFSLERVKRVVTTFLHFVVAVMNQMIETATDDLCTYESTLQPLLETTHLRVEPDATMLEQLLTLCKDAVTKRTSSAAEELDFTKRKDTKQLMANVNSSTSRSSRHFLLLTSRETIALRASSTSS